VATWVATCPPESSGEASMSELDHSVFGLLNHHQGTNNNEFSKYFFGNFSTKPLLNHHGATK
jgi:hypothetical protein